MADFEQDLSQFEPDPDGDGERGPDDELLNRPAEDVEQWVEWSDQEEESAWAAAELHFAIFCW